MDIRDIEIGMKVQFKGTVIKPLFGDCTIDVVRVRNDQTGEEAYLANRLLTPAPKYNPNRKFRKGDLVRITGYHGRLFGGGLSIEPELKEFESSVIGSLAVLETDESEGDVILPDGILPSNRYYISVACIELVKPIEEIEEEQKPYYVKGGAVKRRKDGESIIMFNSKTDELNVNAKIICDILNKEYEKSIKEKCSGLSHRHRKTKKNCK